MRYIGNTLKWPKSDPVFEHRGPVMTFQSRDEAEKYAQTHLRLPEVIGWRTQKFRSV